MTRFARFICAVLIVTALLMILVGLAGCAQIEGRYEASGCDAMLGVELTIGDGGWRARPTLGC